MNKHIGKVFVNRNKHKRRYRQIGRLIYYYCCVRFLTRVHGEWVYACDVDEKRLVDRCLSIDVSSNE